MDTSDGQAEAPRSSGWLARLRRAFRRGCARRKVHAMDDPAPPAAPPCSASTSGHGMECHECGAPTVDVPIDGTLQQFRTLSGASKLEVPAHQKVPRARSGLTNQSGVSHQSQTSQVIGVERTLKSLFHVPDNRLTLKLFGSKNAIRKEEERRKNCRHWVIHPCSKFRIYWDLLMLIFLMLNVVLLPVSIAYFHNTVHPGWLTFNIFSDSVFIVDIILNFWTGIITGENRVILNINEIRKSYAKKWLAIDIISIFPFDYVAFGLFQSSDSDAVDSLLEASKALRLLRLLKLLSLLRLFRVARFLHYLSKWEEVFNATRSVARIVNFILAVLLLAHWNACVQFLVPYIEQFPVDSWVSINHLEHASVGTQYSWALFKAFSHMLCIGFGRWPPQNTTEVWLTIISMLIGASLYAMFIGHISTLIHSATSANRTYNEKLKQVEEYMRYRKLPPELKLRVHEYYYQRYHGQFFNEQDILQELSHSLSEDIVNFNCQELVRVVPFFANADEAFITSVITRLTFEVFLPGELIIRCGAIGNKMYFLQHGMVEVISGDGVVATTLCDGAYFGEICLLMKSSRRVATVRAVTVCDVYSLAMEDFNIVLEEFPEMRIIMEAVAKERLAMIQDTVSESGNEHVLYSPHHNSDRQSGARTSIYKSPWTPTLNVIPSNECHDQVSPDLGDLV